MADFKYEIVENIGKLGEKSKKEVRLISWNDRDPKIDIREWYEKDGEERCGKGVSITKDEAKELVSLLTKYLKEDK